MNIQLLDQVLTALAFVYNNLPSAVGDKMPANVKDASMGLINDLGQALSLIMLLANMEAGSMMEDCENCPAIEDCTLPSAIEYRKLHAMGDPTSEPSSDELTDNDIRGFFGLESSDSSIADNPDNK